MTPAAVLSILVKTEGATAAAGQLKNVDDTAKRSSDSMDKASGSAKKHGDMLGGIAKTGALAAGAAGLGAVVATLKVGIGEWKDSTQVAAQTQAVLKSTGGAAHVTAGHISDLATKLMKKSGIDDEAIQSGENLIATFTNIRNEAGKGNKIFDRTTQAAIDMATAMGTDPKTAAMQLGKALNDPTKGMGRLTRSGVTFTDAQKKMVEKLQASGDTLGAQKIILGEVTKEFGGSAEAAGKTLPGQLNTLKETFNNLAGDLVGKMIPVLQNTIQWLRDHWGEISAAFGTFWSAVQPILKNLWDLLKSVAQVVIDNWPLIQPIVETMGRDIQNVAKVIGAAIKVVTDILKGDWGQAWTDAKQFVVDIFNTLKDHITGIVPAFVGVVLALGKAILEGVKAGLGGLGELGGWMLDQIVAGIKAAPAALLALAGWLKDRLWDGLKAIPGAIQDVGGWVLHTLVAGLKAIVSFAPDVAGWILSQLRSGLSALVDLFHTVGGWIIGRIWAGITGLAGEAASFALNVAKWIYTQIHNGLSAIVELFHDTGGWIINRIWGGIQQVASFALNAAKWIYTQIHNGLTEIKDDIFGLGGNIIGWIVDGLKAGAIKVQSFLNDIIHIINKLPGVDIGDINIIKKAEGGTYGSGTIPAGLARGGAYARTGGKVTSPITLMGEEAPRYPEYVIPTNPAYRSRAGGLLGQAATALGFAAGGRYSKDDLKKLWISQQGNPNTANVAAAVALAESSGVSSASSSNPAGGINMGLWQIWSGNPGATFDPAGNARTAIRMSSNGTDWRQWEAFTNGRYKQFLGGGLDAVGSVVGKVGGIVGDLLSKGVGFILDQLPDTGSLPDWLKGTGKYILDHVTGWVKDKVSGILGSLTGGGGGETSTTGLVPQVKRAVDWARAHGWTGQVTSGFRSYAEQAQLYARYLAGGNLAAKPGSSSHESGQAVDVTDPAGFARALMNAPAMSKIYNRLGAADPVHFSVSGYKAGGVWPYVGSYATGGVVPRTGLAMVHGGETITPAGGATTVVEHHYHGPVVQDKDFIQYLRNLDRSYSRQNGRPAFGA